MTKTEEMMAVSAPISELPQTQTLTTLLTYAAKSHNQTLTRSHTTIIPILRGALPMFVAAQPLLPATSCILAR